MTPPQSTSQPSGMHLAGLDELRGVAILLVFFYHCLSPAFGVSQAYEWNGWWRSLDLPDGMMAWLPLTFGWSGVSLFFAISGFCIHTSGKSRGGVFSTGVGRFFTRRFFRIAPPYLVALLLFSFVWPFARVLRGGEDAWAQFFSHLFLVHNFDDRMFGGINGAFWSIAVEFQLYLLYPLLIAIQQRVGWRGALWVTGGIEVGIRAWIGLQMVTQLPSAPDWLTGSPFCYWFSWAVGAAAADHCSDGNADREFGSLKGALYWTVLAVLVYFIKPLSPFSFTLFAIAGVWMMLSLINRGGRTNSSAQTPQWWRRQLVAWGVCSYSIYLFHQPFLRFGGDVLAKVHPVFTEHPTLMFLALTASAVVALPLGLLSFRWLEDPSNAFGKALVRKPKRSL